MSVVIVGVIRRKPVLTHASIVCEGMLASVNSVNSVGTWRGTGRETQRQTDGRGQYTFCLRHTSRKHNYLQQWFKTISPLLSFVYNVVPFNVLVLWLGQQELHPASKNPIQLATKVLLQKKKQSQSTFWGDNSTKP